MSAVDYFLKIEGVDGESADSKHKGEIDLESYSFGCSNAGSMAHGGGGGAGKVQMNQFHFSKRIDKSSPFLFQACASGQHFKKATFFARKAGGEQMEYMKVTMTDVLVSSFQSGPGGGPLSVDQASFDFAKIEFEYSPQGATGAKDGNVTKGWDVKANTKV